MIIRRKFIPNRKTLIGVGIIAVVVGQLIFFPLPKIIIPLIAKSTANWVLNNHQPEPTKFEIGMKKLVGEMLQQSLIAHFHSAGKVRQGNDDAAFAGAQLERLRPLLINQSELYHLPAQGPVALSGLAWCDMANGLAGRLLAHDFQNVQLVGVRDPNSSGGHSFGRFWSYEYDAWLYFDVWTEEVVIFRIQKDGQIAYLYRSQPLSEEIKWPTDIATARRFHSLAVAGYVHNKLQSTVGGYFIHRIVNYLMHGNTAPLELNTALGNIVEQSTPITATPPFEINAATIELYTRARVEHFLGNIDQAENYYRQSELVDQGKTIFGRAAHIFVNRISSVKHL